MVEFWGHKKIYENSATTNVLGINFIDMKKSILDMAESLIEIGYIPDRRNTKKGCF